MNTTVFEAINITKKYRNTLALNQVSMSVMQGRHLWVYRRKRCR